MHCDLVKSRQGQRGNTDLGRRLSRIWAPVPPRICSALGICVVRAAISGAPGIYGGLTLCQAPLSICTGGISFNPANGSIIIPITWGGKQTETLGHLSKGVRGEQGSWALNLGRNAAPTAARL